MITVFNTTTGTPPEPTLGGLTLTPVGMTGDPAVLMWLAAIASTGRAW